MIYYCMTIYVTHRDIFICVMMVFLRNALKEAIAIGLFVTPPPVSLCFRHDFISRAI